MSDDEEEVEDDAWVKDTGLTCAHDGDTIEYGDPVICVQVVKPYIDQTDGGLKFWDIPTEDQTDYLYEPVLFHTRNWEEIEERFEEFIDGRTPVPVAGPILHCGFCKSGILQGETTGLASLGEIIRSQRNPDLKSYGNHFENLDRNPKIICVVCLMDLNKEVHELWPDGVCHDAECEMGTYGRCWRAGCPGNCEQKQ